MKSALLGSVSLPAALAASIFSMGSLLAAIPAHAQVNAAASASVTREQVRAELKELVDAGYNPRDWYHYPDNIQAAERIVQQRHEALAQQQREDTGATKAGPAVTEESYGGNTAGKSETGAPTNDQGTWQHGAMPCSMDPQCGLYRGH